ncbi:uncharacterized protein LOC142771727 isoform X2 [Rhipicephalus microplus]|uniref:uncharacterized protein LOC142771727 isoform X2 n=1 Tax=Rhipicephalus microplus TaxID=6941 RepID=UPI003F6BDD4F
MLDSPILGCLPRSPCRNACSDPWKTTNACQVTSHSTRLKGLHPSTFFSGLGRSGVSTMPDRRLFLQFAFWSAALLLCSAEPRIVPDPSPWPAHANFAVPPESPIDDVPGRLVMLDSPILGCLPRSPCRNACSDPWKTTNACQVTSHSTRLKGLHPSTFFSGLGRSGVSTMPDRRLFLQFAFWSAALLLCSAEPRIVPDPSPWPAHANVAVPPESPIDDVPGRLVMLDSPILGCLPRSPCRNACSDPWKTTNACQVTSHSTRLKGLHPSTFFSGLGRSGVSTMPDRRLFLQMCPSLYGETKKSHALDIARKALHQCPPRNHSFQDYVAA